MKTSFVYTSPEGLTLDKSTEELMLAVDNFSYNVLNPEYSSFGEIHDTLEIRIVSSIAPKKHTTRVTLGRLRAILIQWEESNKKIESYNNQIRQKIAETKNEDLYSQLKPSFNTNWLSGIIDQNQGKNDSYPVAIETEHDCWGFYTRENGHGLIVLTQTYNENQMVATLIHEYIHAWADQEATNSKNDAEYAEEEIAEFGMLHFLQTIAVSNPRFKQILMSAYSQVVSKQNSIGLAHYGFGAELYNNYININWEGLLRDAHTLVGPGMAEYDELEKMLQTSPDQSELNETANLLYKVLLHATHYNTTPHNITNAGKNTNNSGTTKNAQPPQILPQSNPVSPGNHERLIGYFKIAGLTVGGRAQDLKSLNVYDIVEAKRQPNNRFDRNAILLSRLDGRELGFVPMFKPNDQRNLLVNPNGIPLFSATVAYMLDNNLPLTFVVSNINADASYKERWIEIEVYGN